MEIRVRGLRVPLDYRERDIEIALARSLKIPGRNIKNFKMVKQAVDARRKTVCFVLTVDVLLPDDISVSPRILQSPDISPIKANQFVPLLPGKNPLPYSPLIVGAGPAGLFCALVLARYGYQPVVIEQGEDMERRVRSVNHFWRTGRLDPFSNTQFGEGGAGTFSDGKLTTRIGDERIDFVLQTFVQHGAAEEIIYQKKPHVGTDMIRQAVKSIRREILERGGEIYFKACLTDIIVNKTNINSIMINKRLEVPCSKLVLAVGNSARPIFRLLYRKGVHMVPKAFAVGLRVEHSQGLIDRIQYGEYAGHPRLGAADYHLTFQDKSRGRALYSFCMCPGGYVIAAASEAEQVVTNGMSYFDRNTGVANAALVLTVKPQDWDNSVLGGMELQAGLEKRAFVLGGGGYRAPVQRLTDFLAEQDTVDLEGSLATYRPGVTPANLWRLLPRDWCQVLQQGIRSWGNRMTGFIDEKAVLTGVETRTSTPLRISRNDNMVSPGLDNLYPCGEGAGYSGGIMSSAVDGIKVAEQIITCYNRPGNKIAIQDPGLTSARDL